MANAIFTAIESLINGAYAQVTNKAEFNELTKAIAASAKKASEARAKELMKSDVESAKKSAKDKSETKASGKATEKPATKGKAKSETKATKEVKETKESKKREKVAQIALTDTKAIKALGLTFEKVEGWTECVLLKGDTRPIYDYLKGLNLTWSAVRQGWQIPTKKNEKYGDTYSKVSKALGVKKIKVA